MLAAGSQSQLLLLGPLELAGDRVNQTGREATKELLAYLALHPQGGTRDEILAALWPAEPEKKREQRFWRATIELRRVLPNGLRREGESYLLDRNEVVIDLDQLEQVQRRAGSEKDPARKRELLEQMLALFRGEPFVGIETEWAEAEARHLRALEVSTNQQLGRLRLESGDPAGALAAAEQGITLDELNEPLWRLALEAEAQLGLAKRCSSVTKRWGSCSTNGSDCSRRAKPARSAASYSAKNKPPLELQSICLSEALAVCLLVRDRDPGRFHAWRSAYRRRLHFFEGCELVFADNRDQKLGAGFVSAPPPKFVVVYLDRTYLECPVHRFAF